MQEASYNRNRVEFVVLSVSAVAAIAAAVFFSMGSP